MLLAPMNIILKKHIEHLISMKAPLSRRFFAAALADDPVQLSDALSMGADPSQRLSNGWTALMVGCASGSDACVHILGSQPSAMDLDQYGNAALHHAAMHGSLGCIKALSLLPESGAMRQLRNARGRSPLMCAAAQGLDAALDALFHSSDAAALDLDGNGLLHLGALSGSAPCCSRLLALCNPLELNANGETPLHLAAAGAFSASIRALVGFGGAGVKNAHGMTPLEMLPQGFGAIDAPFSAGPAPRQSVEASELECCRLLWDAMSKAARRPAGHAAFLLACERGRARLASMLLDFLLADGACAGELAKSATLFDFTPTREISSRAESLAEAQSLGLAAGAGACREAATLRI